MSMIGHGARLCASRLTFLSVRTFEIAICRWRAAALVSTISRVQQRQSRLAYRAYRRRRGRRRRRSRREGSRGSVQPRRARRKPAFPFVSRARVYPVTPRHGVRWARSRGLRWLCDDFYVWTNRSGSIRVANRAKWHATAARRTTRFDAGRRDDDVCTDAESVSEMYCQIINTDAETWAWYSGSSLRYLMLSVL